MHSGTYGLAAATGRLVCVAATCVLLTPSVAHADSDGYYCVGADYIAFQFGIAAPPVASHRLTVVRFGGGSISAPVSINLPQFQVHGMRCGESAINVASIDSIYTVQLSAQRVPLRVAAVALSVRGELPEWTRVSRNLGLLSPAARSLEREVYVLRTEQNGVEYVLEVLAEADSVRACPPMLTSRIVERVGAREVGEQILWRGTGRPSCGRVSLAPLEGNGLGVDSPDDVLLGTLVFGPRSALDVGAWSGAVRDELREYLRRADAYRSSRPPVGIGDMAMVDAARANYERLLVAIARDTGVAALAVAFVDSLRPCYEWEGMSECPLREARFADSYAARHADGPWSEFLPLFAAHRWLCAAEGFDREGQPADAEVSRRNSAERLLLARGASGAMIRAAARRLAERGRCQG